MERGQVLYGEGEERKEGERREEEKKRRGRGCRPKLKERKGKENKRGRMREGWDTCPILGD
jgi:hypothetical protein